MKNGAVVREFEQRFAEYVGAKYAIALCNGTATLHTALEVLGVRGRQVAVPPLTMASTTLGVLHAGGFPTFVDVDERAWLMRPPQTAVAIGVSLYGLHYPAVWQCVGELVDDAAQTLRPHGKASFTSYSFQGSKILSLGEGGMLVTNETGLAEAARQVASLGYWFSAKDSIIDPDQLKSPTHARHFSCGYNYRMSDLVAEVGIKKLAQADWLLANRLAAAEMYREAIRGCEWLVPQYVPEGWRHDYWTYAVALDTTVVAWEDFAEMIVSRGGEKPYAAWRLTYDEPAFMSLAHRGPCPIAESLQPRLMQFQTNNLASAELNAKALRQAIESCTSRVPATDSVR